MLTRIFAFLISVVAFFCNTFGGMQTANKTAPEGAIRIHYGEGVCEYINIFLPDDTTSEPCNVLLTIHGGAWLAGDESEFNDYCREAAKTYGMIAATLDYNKIQNGATAKYMTEEINSAVLALKNTLRERGINYGKMAIAGHSAGAHLSLLYAYTHYEDSPIDIAFVVSNCAPTEFVKNSQTENTTIGKFAFLAASGLTGVAITSSNADKNKPVIDSISPVVYVSPMVPPTIVVGANADEMVPYQNSVDLYSALQQCGVDSVHITYDGSGHFLGKEFEKENEQRSAAFFEFAEKYF